jgi:large subunit ribosomal protein L15
MPFKRGFNNIWRVEYEVVNVGGLQDWPEGTDVTPETLLEARMVRRKNMPVKILGEGAVERPLTVHAHKFSESARQKIEAAGGTVVEVPLVIERRSRSRGPNPSMRNRAQE